MVHKCLWVFRSFTRHSCEQYLIALHPPYRLFVSFEQPKHKLLDADIFHRSLCGLDSSVGELAMGKEKAVEDSLFVLEIQDKKKIKNKSGRFVTITD